MGYLEGILSRAVNRLQFRLKKKDKHIKRIRNRQKLYKKRLSLNRKL